MATVRWIKTSRNAVIVPGTTVQVGSEVHGEGRFYDAVKVATYFEVIRHLDGFARRYLRWKGGPTQTSLTTLGAIAVTSTSVRSDPFLVPNLQRRGRIHLEIIDNFGNASPMIAASRVAQVNVGPNVQVLGSGGGLGNVIITAAIDPKMDFRVLVPWDGSLPEFLSELADEMRQEPLITPHDDVFSEMLSLLEWAWPDKQPDGWEIDFEPREIEMDEYQTRIVRLRLQTPTPGAAAFAIEARTSEGEAATSDIVVLEVDDELRPAITPP